MPFGSNFTIGQLRFQVTLATRQEIPDPNGTGILETFVNQTTVWADISPIGLQTWVASEQISSPITHRITLRWHDNLTMFDCVLRTITRPNDQTTRQELYRIRRVAEFEGRQRFSLLDCELESRIG